MDEAAVFSAIATGLAAVSAAISAWSVRQVRNQRLYELGHQFEDRLDPLTKTLMTRLGPPDDGIKPQEFRMLAVDFVVLYAQAYRAHRLGLFPRDQWDGVNSVFAYWLERPEMTAAWSRLSQQTDAWPNGFIDFVNEQLEEYRDSPTKPRRSAAPTDPFDTEPSVE